VSTNARAQLLTMLHANTFTSNTATMHD